MLMSSFMVLNCLCGCVQCEDDAAAAGGGGGGGDQPAVCLLIRRHLDRSVPKINYHAAMNHHSVI